MSLEIFNLTQDQNVLVWLKEIAKKVSQNLKIKKDFSVILVGDKKIRQLNWQYRKKNKITDVLSFEGEADFLGEVVISLPEAKRQAKKYKLNLKIEMSRLLIHGILHLLGFDHEKNAKEAEKMYALQDKLLIGIFKKYVLSS
ncbi:MAG: putative rRNA maturation factor [Candidatus Magasanikbacteria bacterium GW2011_GWC2_40_17]|uniref:Endoribonuclease YbeY n=1 Tax=Candidatus Magasanikbacteria bacterium GW2011_GWA2_42_32 TaxID=1619039 RepID=A0A0G1A7E7_9BACT|nr:MAG: putative rRNA maturation factor [Candidatus Magasanikbacteria bacterium GW2011_GWC2_40_17]KKS56874.1 MAG: putative rRNA maturation factor [Candidatus Magasanikbacteria bacterium GW2011_GWA2_42_32]OGH85658.1 MAG: rRNA maturation RNase YbeY [Candidatus Magasanikbacteria bacterium RIFOXYB2_FULL_38_10]